MKIDRITCRVVDFPLDREFHPAWARGRNQPNLLMVLIEVDTDDGLTGIGAAHAGLEAAVTIERFVAPYFIGQDPMHVESLVPVLRDTEILGAPVYCMETTLWDIVGKAAGLPVARLWGGYSDRVIAYCATAEERPGDLEIVAAHHQQRRREPAVLLAEVADARQMVPHDVTAPVGRAVVDHDHLDGLARERLRERALDRLRDEGAEVVDRNDDADPRGAGAHVR